MAVTLKDIAEKADVSITTVSRVLNSKKSKIPVSNSTKDKIFKIADELNYRPNISARELSTKKSYNIGLVLDYVDPYFSEMINSIEEFSRYKQYNLIFSLAKKKSFEEIITTMLNRSSVEGFLIAGTKKIIKKNNIFEKLKNLKIPIVLLSHYYNNIPSVNIDDFKGGVLAAKHLLDLGHKDVAIITGPDYQTREDSKKRFLGYKSVLKDNSIKLWPEFILQGNNSYESGYLSMKKILKLNHRPSAVFICEDKMALGALKATDEFNIKVPDEISIIGFDNIIQTRYSIPNLTTISQPKLKMGEEAIKLLIDLIENNESDIIKQKSFKPELLVRNSCSNKY